MLLDHRSLVLAGIGFANQDSGSATVVYLESMLIVGALQVAWILGLRAALRFWSLILGRPRQPIHNGSREFGLGVGVRDFGLT